MEIIKLFMGTIPKLGGLDKFQTIWSGKQVMHVDTI